MSLLVGGCATTGNQGKARSDLPLVKASGLLTLSDGKPVSGASLRIYCGRVEHRAESDAKGRFVFSDGVPEGDCQLAVEGTRIVRKVRVGGNLMRQGSSALRVTLPATHRVTLRWKLQDCKADDCEGTLIVDERVSDRLKVAEHYVALRGGILHVEGLFARPLAAVKQGMKLPVTDRPTLPQFEVKSIESKPWLPVALRGSPRGSELLALPVRNTDGALVPFSKLLGKRTILLVAKCDALRDDWRTDLEGIADSYRTIGLKALPVAVESCANAERKKGVTFAGPELLWALSAKVGQVVLLDERGAVQHKVTAPKQRLLEATVAHLEKSWSSFAALQRVTLQQGEAVAKAEAERLLAQATTQAKAGKHTDAHRLLTQVLVLIPDSIEAHRQLALTKAALGDLGGALNQVTWWRTSFGDIAAEELMDAVRQQAKVTALR